MVGGSRACDGLRLSLSSIGDQSGYAADGEANRYCLNKRGACTKGSGAGNAGGCFCFSQVSKVVSRLECVQLVTVSLIFIWASLRAVER